MLNVLVLKKLPLISMMVNTEILKQIMVINVDLRDHSPYIIHSTKIYN